jgi:threonine dehydrogenase-like Zn-dependent dehydrogenase
MRAAQLVAPRHFEIVDVPVPETGAGQVRLRLKGCGVCASNLPPWEGREWFGYPFAPGALGHEAWGTVDALGEGATGFAVGDAVASLGQNAYAEYDVVDAGSVIPLPAELTNTPFPGEPVACAINIFRRACVERGQTVAVIGVGFLGAMLTRLAASAGARVIAIARRPFAQDMARRMGAAEVIAMDDHWQIIEQVKSLTGEAMCPVAIECVGKQWPLDLAAELTGIRGRLVVAGYHQDGLRQVNMQQWNWRGFDVINAHERDPKMYVRGVQDAVQAVATGQIDLTPLMTHELPLDRIGEALQLTSDRPDGFFKAWVNLG